MKTLFILLKKGVSIYCFIIVFVCHNTLHAQIIYTDIPDATPNATYPLDLNNDTIVDFMIHFGASGGSGIGVQCSPLNNNAYAGEFVDGAYLPWALSSATPICETLTTWYDASHPGTMGLGASIGYWPGATNKYVALKLLVGTDTYYGWARFDVLDMSGSFTIKDYAYESTPNACIQSGQTELGTNENTNKNRIAVFPNPFHSTTTIQTLVPLKNATLTLCNSFGQTVQQVHHLSGQSVSLSRDHLPSGLYCIRLTEENKSIVVAKVILTD
jgi:Secretion system C-terminal sorting domain